MYKDDIVLIFSVNALMTNVIDPNIEAFQVWINRANKRLHLVPSTKSDKKAGLHLSKDATGWPRVTYGMAFMADLYRSMFWDNRSMYIAKGKLVHYLGKKCYRFELSEVGSFGITKPHFTVKRILAVPSLMRDMGVSCVEAQTNE